MASCVEDAEISRDNFSERLCHLSYDKKSSGTVKLQHDSCCHLPVILLSLCECHTTTFRPYTQLLLHQWTSCFLSEVRCSANNSHLVANGMKCLRWYEHWNPGFESRLIHPFLPRLFCMSSCVGSGFAAGLITYPRSPITWLYYPQIQINSDGKRCTRPNPLW